MIQVGVKGKIHSVETFGTVDGPGIRYVFFVQGCPLKCKYCHNPDTWERNLGHEVDSDQLINEIKSYLDFYKNSGGGVTASGGEPTTQPDFVEAVFKEARNFGLNTALDTSGFIDANTVEALLNVTDLILLDIKEVNKESHQELTGVSNEKIIEFARHIGDIGIPIWIRHVIIPGINDGVDDIKELGSFLKTIKGIERIELLGFHKMGSPKWKLKGCDDPLADVPAAMPEEVEKARAMLKDMGLKNIV